MITLQYKGFGAFVDELGLNECTIHQCKELSGALSWRMWFCVARETDGVVKIFAVPLIPRGAYTETGPGGRSWGFQPQGGGVWQVSPSINVLDVSGCEKYPGEHPALPSLWHQTPSVVGVPDGEPWQ